MSHEKNKNSNKPKIKFFSIHSLIWGPPLFLIHSIFSYQYPFLVFFIFMGVILLQEKFPEIYIQPFKFLKGLFEEDKNN